MPFLLALITSLCLGLAAALHAGPIAEIDSVFTGLFDSTCKDEIDKTDPNETPVVVCPGAAGYRLVVRRVDSGRVSVDIRDPGGNSFPLRFDQVVTRRGTHVDGQAEWRVRTRQGRKIPIAVIIPVRAHEDDDDPEKVTRTYIVVAKITKEKTCITDRFMEPPRTADAVQRAADSAEQRPCLSPLPDK